MRESPGEYARTGAIKKERKTRVSKIFRISKSN